MLTKLGDSFRDLSELSEDDRERSSDEEKVFHGWKVKILAKVEADSSLSTRISRGFEKLGD